jgi:hypothetical protein
MVIMLPYSFDEILAMLQFMRIARREGQPLWRTFWRGGTCAGARASREPALALDLAHIRRALREASGLPLALSASAALGAWLMFTRLLFDTTGTMANSDHLVGALVFTVSISAFAEVVRSMRVLNALAGVWLLLAPWVLDGANAAGAAGSVMVGLLLIVLSLPRGPVRHRYAGWDRYLAW